MNSLRHFRQIRPANLDLDQHRNAVRLGNYTDEYVQGLLNLEDFDFTLSSDSLKRISREELLGIRRKVVDIQNSAISLKKGGEKSPSKRIRDSFDQAIYRQSRELFPLLPYEASKAGIWDYLTVRLLLDVAMWRFDTDAVSDRFIGLNRSRHVFARWWFRRDISILSVTKSDFQLNETVWENIFERPTLCWNPDVTNACLRVLQSTRRNAQSGDEPGVSASDRLWVKQILRLTSQSALDGFDEDELYEIFLARYPK